MIHDLQIGCPIEEDIRSAYQVFDASIRDAFEKEGLGSLEENICGEIVRLKHLFDISISQKDPDVYFLVAKLHEEVIGTISFGPCGEDIRRCTENQLQGVGELGSLYVLPYYQGQGVGSVLIHAMIEHLSIQGIEEFCLDSGYKRAQKRWLRKFGVPYKVVKDYWGPGADHMIWLCKVSDFVEEWADK